MVRLVVVVVVVVIVVVVGGECGGVHRPLKVQQGGELPLPLLLPPLPLPLAVFGADDEAALALRGVTHVFDNHATVATVAVAAPLPRCRNILFHF